MSDQVARAPAAVLGDSRERARSRTTFFLGVAVLLLAFVLTGFYRTLFARAFFDVPPIPWYLYVHGLVLSSWFVLLVAQTALVAANRTDLHRRLGILGGGIAVALVAVSLVAVLRFPAHIGANVVSIDTAFPVEVVRTIVWTDLASLLIFSTFVGTALYWRQRSDVHKRLMVLASMAILGPAVARIVTLVSPSQLVGAAIQTLVLVGLPLTVVLHDLLATRRVHRATIIGVTFMLVLIFAAIAIANSSVGIGFVATLE